MRIMFSLRIFFTWFCRVIFRSLAIVNCLSLLADCMRLSALSFASYSQVFKISSTLLSNVTPRHLVANLENTHIAASSFEVQSSTLRTIFWILVASAFFQLSKLKEAYSLSLSSVNTFSSHPLSPFSFLAIVYLIVIVYFTTQTLSVNTHADIKIITISTLFHFLHTINKYYVCIIMSTCTIMYIFGHLCLSVILMMLYINPKCGCFSYASKITHIMIYFILCWSNAMSPYCGHMV